MNARARSAAPAYFDPAQAGRKRLIAKVHVAKTQLRLIDDHYRDVLFRVAGHDSARDCSDAELVLIVKEFERMGFTAKAAAPAARRPADHPVALKARALWISLHHLGAIDNPSELALEAFAKRQLKVDRLQWANQAHGDKLIEALKAIAQRAGWNQDLTSVRPKATVAVLKRRLVDALLDKLAIAMVVPAGWDVPTAAFQLGGVTLAGGVHDWSGTELDIVAKLFGDKLRACAGGAL